MMERKLSELPGEPSNSEIMLVRFWITGGEDQKLHKSSSFESTSYTGVAGIRGTSFKWHSILGKVCGWM